MTKLFDIIHENADLLVVHKPADLVCHPTKGDEYSSLISRVRIYLERQFESAITNHPSNNPPHLIHRLDRETSGLVVIAKNAAAARELGKIWETRVVQKEYLAIVHGHVAVEQGIIDAPLGKDENSRVAIKDCVRTDGAPARTEFFVERRFTSHRALRPTSHERPPVLNIPFSLLRLVPRTGRKHQLRIHLAQLGHPIVGDKLYGGDEDLYLALVESRLTDEQRQRLILPHHALHAGRLQFRWRGQDFDLTCPPEPSFVRFYSDRVETE